MTSRKAVALIAAIAVFTCGLLASALALWQPAHRVVLALSAPVFMLAGLEFFHLAVSPRGVEYRLLSRGIRGLLLDSVYLSAAIGLTLLTFSYQRTSNFFCSGNLGAGFPAPFLCDVKGESPISGWDHMSWADLPNIAGGLLDILLMASLIWLVRLLATRVLSHKGR